MVPIRPISVREISKNIAFGAEFGLKDSVTAYAPPSIMKIADPGIVILTQLVSVISIINPNCITIP